MGELWGADFSQLTSTAQWERVGKQPTTQDAPLEGHPSYTTQLSTTTRSLPSSCSFAVGQLSDTVSRGNLNEPLSNKLARNCSIPCLPTLIP
jgi:hypothetical protein